DGTFSIDLGPGGSTARRSDGSEPDAGLDINALVALVTGAATAETLVADGRAEGDVSLLRPPASALAGLPVFKPHNEHCYAQDERWTKRLPRSVAEHKPAAFNRSRPRGTTRAAGAAAA